MERVGAVARDDGGIAAGLPTPIAGPSGWAGACAQLDDACAQGTALRLAGATPASNALRMAMPLPNVLLVGPAGSGKSHAAAEAAARHGLPFARVDAHAVWLSGKRIGEAIGARLLDIATDDDPDAAESALVVIEGLGRIAPAESGATLTETAALLAARPTLALADAWRRPIELDTRGIAFVVELAGTVHYSPADGYRLGALAATVDGLGGPGNFPWIVPLGSMSAEELEATLRREPDGPIRGVEALLAAEGLPVQIGDDIVTRLAADDASGGFPGRVVQMLVTRVLPAIRQVAQKGTMTHVGLSDLR